MMRCLSFFFLFIFAACTAQGPVRPKPLLEIHEVRPNKWTHLTHQNLEHLLKIYDLSPFIFTRRIQIESGVVPHSHPVLTLNSRFAQSPHRLLSIFLHEQLHWWIEQNSESANMAKIELKKLIPQLPQQGLANSRESTYLHLIICFLEFKALVHYLGNDEANKVLRAMIEEDKIYPWIYHQVYERFFELQKIISKHQLEPQVLRDQKPTKKP